MAQRRYIAFISYRHADNVQEGRRWAEWLHRGLERYVVPPDLVGQPNLRGEPIHQSLYPIFRDEDELPANADLATGIRSALETSDCLIVLCSPRSAASPWVRKEVREFKELGRSDRILAVIVAGEPNADDPAKARDGVMRDEECFCEELRFGMVGTGGAIDWSARTEPTAADLRPPGTRAEGFVTADAYREYLALNSSHSPERIAALADAYRQRLDQVLLKVIAGLLGVALGTLVDRDAAHRAELSRKELARAEAEATRLRTFNRRLRIAGVVALTLAVLAGFFWRRSAHDAAAAMAANQLAGMAAQKAARAEQEAKSRATEATAAADRLRMTRSAMDQQIGHKLGEQGRYNEALVYEARALSPDESPRNTAAITDSIAFLGTHARLARVVIPHGGEMSIAAFSPDGTRVVVSDDKTARVWDADTGKPLTEPMRHGDIIESVAFSPDGTRVVTASDDKTARLWDAATGKPAGEPMQHDEGVHTAEFSPDGKQLATVTEHVARVWDVATGKPQEIATPDADDGIRAVAFSPNGTRVVTASKDKTAQVWDVATGKRVGEPMRHEYPISSATFSPDGTRVVTATLVGNVRIWQTATGKPSGDSIRYEGRVESVKFSPDGTRMVTASGETAQMWDAFTGKLLGEPMRHENIVFSATFSPDGTRVVTASGEFPKVGVARVWDARTGKPLGEPMRHENVVDFVAFSPDGTRVGSTSADKTARIWDATAGKPLGEPMRREKSENGFHPIVFSPDGTRVILASDDSTAQIWDVASAKPLGEPMSHHSAISSAEFSPDGKRVVTASFDETAQVWDAATGKPLGERMRADDMVFSAVFSPDSRRVVTASAGKVARVWDATTGRPLGEPMRDEHGVVAVAFSPDGLRVITARDFKARSARVWDAATGKPLGETTRYEEMFHPPDVSPDGTRVLRDGHDAAFKVICDAVTGKPIGEPMSHEHSVNSAVFSPDGAEVVTASQDKTARLWDAETGKPLGTPFWHDGVVTSTAFSPDGTRILTVSADNMSRMWDVGVRPVGQQAFDWISQLDKLGASAHLGPSGTIESLGTEWQSRRDALARTVAGGRGEDVALAKAVGWFLADPRHRPISPLSTETTEDWLRRRDDEFTAESLQSAWEADPTDPLCLARRGRDFATGPAQDLYWADLYSRLATERAIPGSAAATEAIWRRVTVLFVSGRRAEAASLADRGATPAPEDDAWAWEAKWEACVLLHRDAIAAADRLMAKERAEDLFWYNRKSYDERVMEAEQTADTFDTAQPTTTIAR